MRALSAIFLGIVFLSSLYFVSSRFASGVNVEPQVLASSTELTQTQRLFLNKINALRTDAGVDELAYSEDIEKLTDFRVSDMSSREYYSHRTPDGTDYSNYLNNFNIETSSSCENLQLQIGSDIDEAIEAWKNSRSHYLCVINPKLNKIAFSYLPFEIGPTTNSKDLAFVFSMIAVN